MKQTIQNIRNAYENIPDQRKTQSTFEIGKVPYKLELGWSIILEPEMS